VRFVRDRGGYLGDPSLYLGVLLRHLLAEERHRTEILCGLRLDLRRHEALGTVAQHDELRIIERQRAEKAERGVAHRLELFGRELVAVDVRHAGIVAAAEEIAAIRREHEPLRHR
jgi:hypothetical protein